MGYIFSIQSPEIYTCINLAKSEMALSYPRKLKRTSYSRAALQHMKQLALYMLSIESRHPQISIDTIEHLRNRAPVVRTYRLISLSRRFRLSPSLDAAVETLRNALARCSQ